MGTRGLISHSPFRPPPGHRRCTSRQRRALRAAKRLGGRAGAATQGRRGFSVPTPFPLLGRPRGSPRLPTPGISPSASPSAGNSPTRPSAASPGCAPGEVTAVRGLSFGRAPHGGEDGEGQGGLGFPRERVLCPPLQAGPPRCQPHRTKKEPAPRCQGQPRAARSPRLASQTTVALRLSEGLMINLPPRGHGGARCAQGAPAPPPHPSQIALQGSAVPTALGMAQPQHAAGVRSGGLGSKEPGSPTAAPQLQKTRGFCTRFTPARHRPRLWERHELDLG